MKIPKYVQEMVADARFDRSFRNPSSNPGYTIIIPKRTYMQRASTFRKDLERLVAWATREHADAEILECPANTRYVRQVALVTITDPVMKYLEPYMIGEITGLILK